MALYSYVMYGYATSAPVAQQASRPFLPVSVERQLSRWPNAYFFCWPQDSRKSGCVVLELMLHSAWYAVHFQQASISRLVPKLYTDFPNLAAERSLHWWSSNCATGQLLNQYSDIPGYVHATGQSRCVTGWYFLQGLFIRLLGCAIASTRLCNKYPVVTG